MRRCGRSEDQPGSHGVHRVSSGERTSCCDNRVAGPVPQRRQDDNNHVHAVDNDQDDGVRAVRSEEQQR
ncbi:hypothetical protein DMN91_009846 [Ooceraea biroi]|uniref:Uncharacterized protein n=1 Tax=Ooceraea biroi TaxID=2015173 RepID=A0A3L8DAT7_OOCBI|nr:hypothetical protein DMN91_009846 [Ooceraea biroi]